MIDEKIFTDLKIFFDQRPIALSLNNPIFIRLGLKTKKPDVKDWKNFVERITNGGEEVEIAIIGKYTSLMALKDIECNIRKKQSYLVSYETDGFTKSIPVNINPKIK